MKIDGVRLCVFFLHLIGQLNNFFPAGNPRCYNLTQCPIRSAHSLSDIPSRVEFPQFCFVASFVFVCRFLFYYWERKHDGGKKIGRRIALLACSSVRFAAQREKWEGPHNRAHHQPARFVPDFLVELICVCLFVCRTLENTHSLVRFSPFGKKKAFFVFLFISKKIQSDLSCLLWLRRVTLSIHFCVRAPLFLSNQKNSKFYFSPWRKAAGRAATPVKRIGSMIHSPRGVNIP